ILVTHNRSQTKSTLFPYTTLFRSEDFLMIRELKQKGWTISAIARETGFDRKTIQKYLKADTAPQSKKRQPRKSKLDPYKPYLLRSEEHTSELQSRFDLVCRLLLEK